MKARSLFAPFALLSSFLSAMPTHHLYIGTYTRDGSKGIYALTLDGATGALSTPTVAAETGSPSFIALSPDHRFLYAVNESEQMAVAYGVDAATGKLTALQPPQSAGGKAPCHLVVDATGRSLVVANYHTGIVAALPIRADGTLGAPGSVIQHTGSSINPERQSSPHVHSVTLSPDNRHVIVCDLGLDKIFTYRLDPATAKLTPAEPPFVATAPGSGPRHFKFSPDGRHAFAITEMGGTMTSYVYNAANGALTPVNTLSTLQADFKGTPSGAEVRVHPNGRFVYGSDRTISSIAVFAVDPATGKLSLVEITPTGGKSPRNFALSPDGAWLVSANQYSNSLTVFRVDPATGRLTRVPDAAATISTPVCVLFAD
ncbi:MAG: lactonase family protein [Verrucomicrobia bacterium]|nr:lactonase family protein [Verrucomicrobiota bacterium]